MFSLEFLPSFIALSTPATLRSAIWNVFYLKFILKYFFYFLKVEWAAAFLCHGCETSISNSLNKQKKNSSRALHFFVHFFAVLHTNTAWYSSLRNPSIPEYVFFFLILAAVPHNAIPRWTHQVWINPNSLEWRFHCRVRRCC